MWHKTLPQLFVEYSHIKFYFKEKTFEIKAFLVIYSTECCKQILILRRFINIHFFS